MLMFDLLALAWAGGPHARRDVHGRARAQQSALSEERRERGLPQRVAPLGDSGEHRPAREAQRVPHAHDDRVLPAQARRHAGRRRHAARPFARRVRQRHGAIRTSTITTRCRCCSRAAAPGACKAGGTCASPDDTPVREPARDACSTSSTCRSSRSATARARSRSDALRAAAHDDPRARRLAAPAIAAIALLASRRALSLRMRRDGRRGDGSAARAVGRRRAGARRSRRPRLAATSRPSRALLDAGASRPERAGPRRHAAAALDRAPRRRASSRSACSRPERTSNAANRYGVTPLHLAIEQGDAPLDAPLARGGRRCAHARRRRARRR